MGTPTLRWWGENRVIMWSLLELTEPGCYCRPWAEQWDNLSGNDLHVPGLIVQSGKEILLEIKWAYLKLCVCVCVCVCVGPCMSRYVCVHVKGESEDNLNCAFNKVTHYQLTYQLNVKYLSTELTLAPLVTNFIPALWHHPSNIG